MCGLSLYVDNVIRLRRLSSTGYLTQPYLKKWYKVLKKQKQTTYWQDTPTVRASYTAVAICFWRGWYLQYVGTIFCYSFIFVFSMSFFVFNFFTH